MNDVDTQEAKRIIPQRIERELARKGWTKYRLAQETGISHATMHNICSGVHDPKASNLKSIADALEITVDSLLEPLQKKNGKSPKSAARTA